MLDDKLSLTLGMRYNRDKKEGTRLLINGAEALLPYSYSENRFDPAVTIAYNWAESINTYLRWSTAYRGGGVNTRSVDFGSFNSDDVESWELGLKSEFWDRRVRLNAALFHTEWNDQQIDVTPPSTPSNTQTINSDKTIRYTGTEIDLSVIPVAGLTLNVSYGYLDALSTVQQFNPFSQQEEAFFSVMAPRHTVSASAEYEFEPTDFGTLRAYVGMKYSDEQMFNAAQFAPAPSYKLWDARLTLSDIPLDMRGALRVSLWGKNLLDEEYVVYSLSLFPAPLIDSLVNAYGTPRTYGLDITYQY